MGIKKQLRIILNELADLSALAHRRSDQLTGIERQLRPPTMADTMAYMGRRVSMLGATLSNTPPPTEPPTVYQMLKYIYDRAQNTSTITEGTGELQAVLNDVQTSIARIRSRQHVMADTISKKLSVIERKLGQQQDLEGLIKELKAVLPDVTGVANNLSKMRANEGHDAKALRSSLAAIEDKLTALGVTGGNGHRLIVDRVAELRQELHGLMDDERAERQRLGQFVYQHVEKAHGVTPDERGGLAPAGANVITDAPKEAEASVEAQIDEVSARVMARSTLERVKSIDTRIKHISEDMENLVDRAEMPINISVAEHILKQLDGLNASYQELKDQLRYMATGNGVEAIVEKLDRVEVLVRQTEGFAINTPTAHQMHQLHELVTNNLEGIQGRFDGVGDQLSGMANEVELTRQRLIQLEDRLIAANIIAP